MLKLRLQEMIFEAETPAGKAFDVILIFLITVSVFAVMMDSIESINIRFGNYLYIIEWFFTIIFTFEYILRIVTTGKPFKYIISFFGIVDVLSVIPTYLSLILPGSQFLIVIRALRLLRVFRVLKLAKYLYQADTLMTALRASRPKVIVFLSAVLMVVIIVGSLMYVIEGNESGYTSIPVSIYWAIVTLTTVGYGDISPATPLGQFLASVIMIMGYSIIAVPTGIVTMELSAASAQKIYTTEACPECSREGHDSDASYCKYCGSKL